jgi:uncharacterized protein
MANLTPSRLPARNTTDQAAILEVLEETPFCTVSYVENGKPYALPTGFCVFENELVIHGSIKSHFLEAVLSAGDVCITTFLFDGLILAASAFNHSVNYRSTAIFGQARELTDPGQKAASLQAFTERYVPGRWPHLRPMTEGEVQATRAVAIPLDQASLKQRSGGPGTTQDPWTEKVWMGVVPARQVFGEPIPFEGQEPREVPEHVKRLLK